jgi:hypothetical protein
LIPGFSSLFFIHTLIHSTQHTHTHTHKDI